MSNFAFLVAVVCICVWQTHASTPILCGRNEEYSECGSGCGDNCPAPVPVACPAVCVAGCTCKRDFARDPRTKQCIPIQQCNVKCPRNSTFGCVCNDSCEKDQIRCFTCNYRCACNTGFSRINGICQPDRLCPSKPRI